MTERTGKLRKLVISAGETRDTPAAYALPLVDDGEERHLALDGLLGYRLRIHWDGEVFCLHCDRRGRKSYGGGYCFPCFRRLARCDLCVVSPTRCHFGAGTCREPAWGEAFCMQPHRVYLANSSGLKVGLTRRGQEVTRWLDQGASQGLVVGEAATRQAAGFAEALLAKQVSDRTDWRALVRGDAEPLDLSAARDRLLEGAGAPPPAVTWVRDAVPAAFTYPVSRYGPVERLKLSPGHPIEGTLLGMKGQFLLLDSGVFNVRQHNGYRVNLSWTAAAGEPAIPRQPALF